MTVKTPKISYTIPCSSSFRDAINTFAAEQNVNVADLARSILLVIPETAIRQVPDPGDPPPDDREEWKDVPDKFEKHFSEKPGNGT